MAEPTPFVSSLLGAWSREAPRMTGAHRPWVADLRREAARRLAIQGMPTPRLEEWRNTDVSVIAGIPFRPVLQDSGETEIIADRHLLPDLGDAYRLTFSGGRLCGVDFSGTPQVGVEFGSVRAFLVRPDPMQARHLSWDPPGLSHGFSSLNDAFLQDGAFVRIPSGVRLDRPVHLVYARRPAAWPSAVFYRNLVVAEPGSDVLVVEHHVPLGQGTPDQPFLTNAVTHIVVGDGARVRYVRIQADTLPSTFHVASVRVRQGPNGEFSSHSTLLGGTLARTEVHVSLEGSGASTRLSGLALGHGDQVVDHLTVVDHTVPGTRSRQLFKSVLTDRSRGVFNGLVRVRRGADRTDAYQSNRNLLLSPGASVHARPQLEILADDVRCSHGSATGNLDEDALFYLRSRGLDATVARRMLLDGFVQETLDEVPEGPVRDLVRVPVEAALTSVEVGEVT